MIPILAAFLRGLASLLRVGVVLAMLLILLATIGQVADRHVIKSGFGAFDQYGRLGLVWLTFLGIAVAVRERANIRIDLADHFLPAPFARAKNVSLDILMASVAIILVVVGWPLLEVGEFQVIMDTPFSYQDVYAALLLGMAIIALFLTARLLDGATAGRFHLDTPPNVTGAHDPL